MADDKPATVQCEFQYRPDRHVARKLAQVYRLVAPAQSCQCKDYEQTSSHLCPGLLRPAEGAEHDRQPDGGADGVRPNSSLYHFAAMDI